MGREEGDAGPSRLLRAGRHSAAGFADAWRGEAAFRQEAVLAALLVPLALWLPVSTVERALLLGSVLLVLVVELLNSAVEAVVDRIGPERHDLSRRAKDLGSAAVLMALVLVVTVWAAVLWPWVRSIL